MTVKVRLVDGSGDVAESLGGHKRDSVRSCSSQISDVVPSLPVVYQRPVVTCGLVCRGPLLRCLLRLCYRTIVVCVVEEARGHGCVGGTCKSPPIRFGK